MKTENYIHIYNTTITLQFSERGDNFTLDVPHYSKWSSYIKFLRNRGFKVGANEFYTKDYSCLSKYHKIAKKGEVIILLEIANDSIKAQFTHIKNLWDCKQSAWDSKSDSRYTKLTYIENLRIENEVYRTKNYFSNWASIINDKNIKLPAQEYIINNLKTNTHIHGVVTCLNDIKVDMMKDNYNYHHNSNDKNKKKIICGEVKYFYDYDGRLKCGIVWHNINNMWWVISGKDLKNKASFDLFDFEPGLPRRKVDISKINRIIEQFAKSKNFLKAHKVQSANLELINN